MLHSGTLRGRFGYAPGNWLFLCDRRFRLDLRPAHADATRRRHDDRFPVPVATGLGGGGRRRVRIRAELDGERRVSVHEIRQQQRDCFRPQALQFTSDFSLQRGPRRAELSASAAARTTTQDGGSSRGCPRRRWTLVNFHGQTTFVWQGYPAIRSPYHGPLQPARQRARPRNVRHHALCRLTAVARRRAVDQPGDRSRFRFRGHARRRRISERRVLQARVSLPLRAHAARISPADHQSRRRGREGRRRSSASSPARARRTASC